VCGVGCGAFLRRQKREEEEDVESLSSSSVEIPLQYAILHLKLSFFIR
jgi:hypothetical protein